jgi:hypothetical protein
LDIHLFRDEIALSHLTQNEYEDSMNAQAREGPDNMLCNTDQQGYNHRSKSTHSKFVPHKDESTPAKPSPQKDNHVSLATKTSNKNPERKKVQTTVKISSPKEDKFLSPFSIEHEISKMKIPIPLTKLVKTNFYRSHILK